MSGVALASWSPMSSTRDAKDSLARLVDADRGRDGAENGYYEVAADPQFVLLERSGRRFRGS